MHKCSFANLNHLPNGFSPDFEVTKQNWAELSPTCLFSINFIANIDTEVDPSSKSCELSML